MQEKTSISQRRACRLVGLSRSVLNYEPEADVANQALAGRIIELAAERRRFGYRRIHVLLRREGHQANHKRVFRLYQGAGLAVRRRKRRRGVAVERQPLVLPSGPNQVWSMDFVMDALSNGRRLKCLTIVDDFTKEAVDLVVDHSIRGADVGTRSRSGGCVSRISGGGPHGSGTGVHRQRPRPMGRSKWGGAEAHRSGQADAEWLHRIV